LTLSRVIQAGQLALKLEATVFNMFNRKNVLSVYDPFLFETTGEAGGIMCNPAAYASARHAFFSLGVEW
ncbi:MAG TPA: hypothetical protein PK907_09540, partial [Candidatus Sabulitectum sp.]|nr:hypothetical protein [Candidatus Sabulitectum sp.]